MQIADVTPQDDNVSYDEDLLLDISAGVVSTLIRGRNAWHSTWVKHYFKNAALYSTTQSARAGAERLRGPGNVFYIVETRALLLRGNTRGIIICDSHSSIPFQDYIGDQERVRGDGEDCWVDGLHPGVSLWDAFETFSLHSEFWTTRSRGAYSLKTGEVPRDFEFQKHSGPLRSWESYAQGTGYLLGWLSSGEGTPSSTQGVDRIVDYWAAKLVEVQAQLGAAETLTSAELARYRRKVIGAIPRSEWKAERVRLRSEARRALSDADSLASSAMFAMFDAELEVERAREQADTAKYALLKPADTSAEIRKQREEAAAAEMHLADAEIAFRDAEEHHRQTNRALQELQDEYRDRGLWP